MNLCGAITGLILLAAVAGASAQAWADAHLVSPVAEPALPETAPPPPPPPSFDTPRRPGDELSDAEIRRRLVAQSILRYTGDCACPYHRRFNEKLLRRGGPFVRFPTVRCGDDSAYVRPGGPPVMCYAEDVPSELVAEYRAWLNTNFLNESMPQF